MTIDLVIPTYNNAQGLVALVNEIEAWVGVQTFDVHVIFIDDASLDDTLSVLQDIKKSSNLSIKLISSETNYGQYTATAIGLAQSTADWVLTMDDDLQHHPKEINRLLDYAISENCDLVYGSFHAKKHHFLRNLGTKTLQLFLRWTGHDYTNVTAFRLLSRSVAQQFLGLSQVVSFIEEPLFEQAKRVGFVEVEHFERIAGKSNYSSWKLAGMAWNILMFHSSFPLKFMSRVGGLLAAFCFVLGLVFIYRKLTTDVAIGYTSLIVSIFFSTGLLLFSMSVLGEYLRKIWLQGQNMKRINWKIHESK